MPQIQAVGHRTTGMSTRSGIFVRESSYLQRYVQLGFASNRLLSVSFPESDNPKFKREHPLLDRVDAYLEGETEAFDDVDVAITRRTDYWDVLESLRTVPYGDGVTVEELARMTGGLDPEDESDQQLVRSALSNNPVPLVIPDHRVSDGPSAAPPAVEQRLRSLERL